MSLAMDLEQLKWFRLRWSTVSNISGMDQSHSSRIPPSLQIITRMCWTACLRWEPKPTTTKIHLSLFSTARTLRNFSGTRSWESRLSNKRPWMLKSEPQRNSRTNSPRRTTTIWECKKKTWTWEISPKRRSRRSKKTWRSLRTLAASTPASSLLKYCKGQILGQS